MNIFLYLALILFIPSSFASIEGVWKLSINLQKKTLPVVIQIKQTQNQLTATIFNSKEKVPLTGFINKKEFSLEFSKSYAKLKGTIKGNQLTGKWIRTNKENYEVAFIGTRFKKTDQFKKYESVKAQNNLSGKWKVKLDDDNYGLGIFKQVGSKIYGSILTSTGDYRFLEGYITKSTGVLYGFDGAFSFIINLDLAKDKFKADFYSGKSYQTKISGIRDDKFKLADANKMTKLVDSNPLKFKYKDIDGKLVDISQSKKAKIIQIFGSWCPNCIDETQFFLEWRKKNSELAKKIDFIAVSFEKTQTKKEAIKNLKKLRYKINMNYPIVLADFNKKIKVTDIFPIDKTRAFPTTLYLNSKNNIKKVHTGFSGQATQEFYENFRRDFDKTLEKLVK